MVTRSLAVVVSIALSSVVPAACYRAPVEPLQLDGQTLKVFNRTSQEWTHVEIWLNRYFRVTSENIPPGGRFQAPLDEFVSGFGRRFEFKRMQIRDVRLIAKLPNGQPLEVKKEFFVGGLAGALGGGKR